TLMALVPPPDTAGSRSMLPTVLDQGEVWALSMGTDGSVWFQPRDRREVLTAGATSLLALSFGTVQFPSRVQQEAVVVTWSEMFRQIRALGQRARPQIVLPTLIASTHTLQQVAVNAAGELRSNCYVLASRYAEYAGWMAQEAGHDKAALWWTDKAVALASAGGDRELAAYALVRRALISLYAGDAQQTIAAPRPCRDRRR
ncbi:MAG: transcriptional regulator, partial [Pseudonocardiaceae bacterium]